MIDNNGIITHCVSTRAHHPCCRRALWCCLPETELPLVERLCLDELFHFRVWLALVFEAAEVTILCILGDLGHLRHCNINIFAGSLHVGSSPRR